MTNQEAQVNTPCLAYNRMAKRWSLIDDLLGGTLAMREAGKKWLPKEPREEESAYQVRLDRAVVFGAYSDTVNTLSGKPYRKPITLTDSLSGQLEIIRDNVDGNGASLEQFGQALISEGINRGIVHILVDYPATADKTGKTPNLKQERDNGIKPNFILISAKNLIGWRFEGDRLVEIRIREVSTEPDGQWGEKEVERIRVYGINDWKLYRQTDKKDGWIVENSGTHTFGDVPLISIYLNRTGLMEARPCLEDLAWTNLAHYQSSNDQRNCLRFVRAAVLGMVGLTEDEMAKEIVVGPMRVIRSTNPEAKIEWIEHSGAGLESGEKDIQRLEDQMEVQGLQPLVRKSGGQTATGKAIDADNSESDMQSWVRVLEKGIKKAYEYAAKWIKAELPDDFSVDIYSDFGLSVRAIEDIKTLQSARLSGDLSRETFLKEMKRRAILGEGLDVQEEIDRIESEGPALGGGGE